MGYGQGVGVNQSASLLSGVHSECRFAVGYRFFCPSYGLGSGSLHSGILLLRCTKCTLSVGFRRGPLYLSTVI